MPVSQNSGEIKLTQEKVSSLTSGAVCKGGPVRLPPRGPPAPARLHCLPSPPLPGVPQLSRSPFTASPLLPSQGSPSSPTALHRLPSPPLPGVPQLSHRPSPPPLSSPPSPSSAFSSSSFLSALLRIDSARVHISHGPQVH